MGTITSKSVQSSYNLKLYLKRFDSEEIEVLKKIYKELSARSPTAGIDKETFLQYFPLPGFWGERLFQRFCFKENRTVDYEEFIIGIAICCRGTKQDRIKVLFDVFDLNNDGFIQKSELVAMLSNLPNVMSYIWPNGNTKIETQNDNTTEFRTSSSSTTLITHLHSNTNRLDEDCNKQEATNFEIYTNDLQYNTSESEDETDSEDEPYESEFDPNQSQQGQSENEVINREKKPSKVLIRAQKVKQLELKNKHSSALAQSLIDREIEEEKNDAQDDVEMLVDKIIEECEFVVYGQLSLLEFKAWMEKHEALINMFTKCLHEEIWGLQGNTLLGTIARCSHTTTLNGHTRPSFFSLGKQDRLSRRKLFESILFKMPTRDNHIVDNVDIKPEHFLKIKKLFQLTKYSSFPADNRMRQSLKIKSGDLQKNTLNEVFYFCPRCHTPFFMCNKCHGRPPVLTLIRGQVALECKICSNGQSIYFTSCWNCDWTFQNCMEMIDESEPAKDGILYKYGRHLHLWVSRYFVLIDNVLYYFNKKDDIKPKGFLFLEGCYVEQIKKTSNSSKDGFSINHISDRVPKRLLYTDSQEDCKDWVNALRTSMKQQNLDHLYNIKEQIGQGKFSVVYKGIHKETGVDYAIKVIEKRKASERDKELLRSEMAILRLLRFPNVIYFKEVLDTKDRLYIAMELVKGGELYHLLQLKRRLTEHHTNRIISQLIQTVAYLHKCGILHRDIKPENILLIDKSEDSAIKLTDFGLSTLCGPNQSLFEACGTLAYVAPEVITMKGYNHKADIWSIGVVMYLLLRGKLPFGKPSHPTYMHNHYKVRFDDRIWKGISDSAKDLIYKMLQPHPKKRITASEALQHMWIKNPTAVISDSEIKYTSDDELNDNDIPTPNAYPAINESTFIVSSVAHKAAEVGLKFPVDIPNETSQKLFL